MQKPETVLHIIRAQTDVLDAELAAFFKNAPDLPLYGHLAYFMGFKNEALEDEQVYGGKRFRSSLMLMLGDWYGAREATIPFATALELYHNFTLIHDDVIDHDTHRRGRPTVWQLFGTDHAINDGDAQLLLVSELLAKAAQGVPTGVDTQIYLLQQFRTVLEGQYLDFELTKAKLGDVSVTREAYEEMIRCKTAELLVAAAVGAGMVAGQDEAEIERLVSYARNLGLAYQICDDVVSIWAGSETTGKQSYGDIKERKKTLPILHAYQTLTPGDKQALEQIFNGAGEVSNADCEQVIALLNAADTKQVMEAVIAKHAMEAKAAAQQLSLTPEQRETLCALVDSLLPKV